MCATLDGRRQHLELRYLGTRPCINLGPAYILEQKSCKERLDVIWLMNGNYAFSKM